MANSSYDTLSIRIEADSKQAQSNVDKLSKGLTNLETVAKNLDFGAFGKVEKVLQNISKIDFSNVTRGLDSVVKAFKSIEKASSKAGSKKSSTGLSGEMPSQTSPLADYQMPDFNNLGLVKINSDVADLNHTFGQFENTLQGFTRTFENTFQTTVKTKSVLKSIANVLKQLDGTAIQVTSHGMKKLLTQFARIVRYRIIRKIIQDIYKAITTGVQRIAQFDERTNEAMSQIKSSVEYVKSSIGSALAPIIQALAPVLIKIIDLVGDLFNAIGSLFAMLKGDKTFIQATHTVEDYAEALKKTQSISIDELNVIGEQQKTYYIEIDLQNQEELDKVYANLEKIEALAVAVSLIFLVNWKNALAMVGKAITSLIPTLGSLTVSWKALGVAVAGTVLAITSFADIMTGKLNWRNLATLIGGVAVAVLGLQLAFHKLNITMSGSAIGGLLLIVSAIKDMAEEGINAKNVILLISGTLVTAVSLCMTVLKDLALFLYGELKTAILSVSVALGTLVAGIVLFTTLFNKVKDSWGQMNFWQKLASVIGLVLVAVGTLVAVISAFTYQWHIFAIAVAGVAVGAGMTVGAYSSAGEAPSIQGYATGGFPEDGLFYANHNELVGQFSNGKTAVANNEQITQGIYEAVRDALRDSGTGSPNIKIEMDGYEVAKTVTKRQDNLSLKIIQGREINYGS